MSRLRTQSLHRAAVQGDEQMSEDMTRSEYWAEVASLAKSITEETFADLDEDTQAEVREADGDLNEVDEAREALSERLWETIDGHQWIIYTSYNFDVLRFSDNESYSIDNFGADSIVADGRIKWEALAFGALYADVQEHSDFGKVPVPEEASA